MEREHESKAVILVACLIGAALICLFALVVNANAESCDATGCTWTVTYTEPVIPGYADPTQQAKANLIQTDFYIQADAMAGQPQPAVQKVTMPASKPLGGGQITLTSPKVLVGLGQTVTIRAWVNGTNGVGVGPNAALSFVKDRTQESPPAVIPDMPSNLTVK